MKPNPDNDLARAIADLSENWKTMDPLARAAAIKRIRGTGVSLRGLAKQIGRSESTLRHVLKAAEAPVLDRIRARELGTSTNELVRRGEADKRRREAWKRDADAEQGCQAICEWLKQVAPGRASAEQIVEIARRLLIEAARTGQVPKKPVRPQLPLAQIIEICRPRTRTDDLILDEEWYGAWLGQWTFYAMPDSTVRDMALGLALRKQIES